LAVTLGVVFVGMLSFDTLCPEHRAWAEALGTVSFTALVLAVVGLAKEWAVAPMLAAVACGAGVGVGMIDVIHDPARGRVLMIVFAVTGVIAIWAWMVYLRLAGWDRAVRRSLASDPALDLGSLGIDDPNVSRTLSAPDVPERPALPETPPVPTSSSPSMNTGTEPEPSVGEGDGGRSDLARP
jgi:hypothetical protein